MLPASAQVLTKPLLLKQVIDLVNKHVRKLPIAREESRSRVSIPNPHTPRHGRPPLPTTPRNLARPPAAVTPRHKRPSVGSPGSPGGSASVSHGSHGSVQHGTGGRHGFVHHGTGGSHGPVQPGTGGSYGASNGTGTSVSFPNLGGTSSVNSLS